MTTEELALLTTVAIEPRNRVAGLVWCDWVEEREGPSPALDHLRIWLQLKWQRVDWLQGVGATWCADLLHAANANPVYQEAFYAFKAKLLRMVCQPGEVLKQSVTRSCWGCDNCQGGSAYYQGRLACNGDGVFSTATHWLQQYWYGGRQFLVPLAYPPSWTDTDRPADIVGRVKPDPANQPGDSERAYLILAVATPWLHVASAFLPTTTLIREVVRYSAGFRFLEEVLHEVAND